MDNLTVSHVMIYLGRHKFDGLPIMFGSSDGRHYRRQRINGVSVFDWKIPRPQDKSKFVAYGPIPGLLDREDQTPTALPIPVSEKDGLDSLKSIFEKEKRTYYVWIFFGEMHTYN